MTAAVLAVVVRLASVGLLQGHMREMAGSMGMMARMMDPSNIGAGMESLRQALVGAVDTAVLLALGIAVLAAAGVSLYLSTRITRPLAEMADATQKIAGGDFDRRVALPGSDELSHLAGSLNLMAENLEKTEARRRRLIEDVAHELRTPLSTIQGYMEGLMDGVIPAKAETYHLVYREADRLGRLVADLQKLSRLEAGVEAMKKEDLDLGELISQVGEKFGPLFAAQGIELRLNLPQDQAIRVEADGDKIDQVLTNILSNALNHAKQTVVARLERQDLEAAVTIEDDGQGIPETDLPHVFDRFYRADHSRSRESGGAGIGLTIAKFIVDAHGGTIWAESLPGRGAKVSFRLPLCKETLNRPA